MRTFFTFSHFTGLYGVFKRKIGNPLIKMLVWVYLDSLNRIIPKKLKMVAALNIKMETLAFSKTNFKLIAI